MVDNFVRVTSSGEVEFEKHNQAIMEAGKLAEENKCHAILYDISDAIFKEYHVSGIKHAERADEICINTSNKKRAIFGKPEQMEMLQYFETVAENRSISLKAFTDESEAIEWLKGK